MRFSFVRNLQRQHWLRIIGLVALLFSSLIVTTNGIRAHDGEDHGTPAAQAESHQGHDARECEPTTEQQTAADQLIADTAGALSAYPSPESAEAAGYRLWGRQDPEHGDSPNGTWHYVNWEYKRDDAALDPSKIETIMYGRTPDGGVQVIGGMYLMPRGEEGPAARRLPDDLAHAHAGRFHHSGDDARLHGRSVRWTVRAPGFALLRL